MTDRYPKSREELEAEVATLGQKLARLDIEKNSAQAALNRSEIEKAHLMRRRAPHKLSADAYDAFRRPYRGRR